MKKVRFLSLIMLLLIVTGCGNNKSEQKVDIILNNNLNFEINSELKLSSLVSKKNKVEIINKDEIIDTSSLGTKEIILKYKDKNKEKEYRFKIKIIDTQAPTIEYQKELSTTVGTSIDLLENVKVSDNSKEEIKANVEGNYTFANAGEYTLKYVAIDSSNNKTEEEFKLIVNNAFVSVPEQNVSITNNSSTPSSQTITREQVEANIRKYCYVVSTGITFAAPPDVEGDGPASTECKEAVRIFENQFGGNYTDYIMTHDIETGEEI